MNSTNKDRRQFIKTGIAAGLSLTILPKLGAMDPNTGLVTGVEGAEEIPYEQRPLPYSYAALEPAIDGLTMEIHYSKHASTYAKNLADAIAAEKVSAKSEKLTSLLGKISKYTSKMRNNAGGHYNHEFFWKTMKTPGVMNDIPSPLKKSLVANFGSTEAFTTQFNDAAKNRFGSGWAWLYLGAEKKLMIGSTPNQDNPLMDLSEIKGVPLLGLDVWEHAYYLKYQNKRPDYITAWWSVVDWSVVQKRYEKAK